MRIHVPAVWFALGLLAFVSLTASAQVKIMPLGDSITKGAGDPGPSLSGYRARLFDDLKGVNVKFQFVGCTDNNSGAALFAAGQQFHNGYGTWRTDSLLANFEATKQQGDGDNNMGGFWFSGAPGNGRAPMFPDIVLLLTGANDLGQGATDALLETRLGDLLKWFELHRPQTQVFVGTVLPRGPEKPGFEQYNITVANVNKWLITDAPAWVRIFMWWTSARFSRMAPGTSGRAPRRTVFSCKTESIPRIRVTWRWAMPGFRRSSRICPPLRVGDLSTRRSSPFLHGWMTASPVRTSSVHGFGSGRNSSPPPIFTGIHR